jgi:hypothetical protein
MFRFTIRELVLLTLVVAMGVAWWLDRRNVAGQLKRLAAYEQAGEKERQANVRATRLAEQETKRLLCQTASPLP